jgi:hypothetical protein
MESQARTFTRCGAEMPSASRATRIEQTPLRRFTSQAKTIRTQAAGRTCISRISILAGRFDGSGLTKKPGHVFYGKRGEIPPRYRQSTD